MITVKGSVEIKAMNIIVMFQGYVIVKFFLFTNEGSLVTGKLLTEEVAESAIPDPIRIHMLTKVL
jgi:hypothetical protein